MENPKIDLQDPGIAYAMRQAANNPFMVHNGIVVEELTVDHVIASLVLKDWQKNPHGTAHGGLLYTMADAMCGVLSRADGREYVTLDGVIHYLRAGEGQITGEGRVIRRGRTSVIIEVVLKGEKELARITITMFCIGKARA